MRFDFNWHHWMLRRCVWKCSKPDGSLLVTYAIGPLRFWRMAQR